MRNAEHIENKLAANIPCIILGVYVQHLVTIELVHFQRSYSKKINGPMFTDPPSVNAVYVQVTRVSVVYDLSESSNVLSGCRARKVSVIVPVRTERQHLRIRSNTVHVRIGFLQTNSMFPIAYIATVSISINILHK